MARPPSAPGSPTWRCATTSPYPSPAPPPVDHLVRLRGDAVVPGGAHPPCSALSHVYVLPYRHPRWWPSSGRPSTPPRPGHPRVGPATWRASSTRWASTTTGRGALPDESIDAVRAALTDEFSSHEGDVALRRGRAHAPAGPAPGADLGRRVVAGGAPAGGRAGRRVAAQGLPEADVGRHRPAAQQLREARAGRTSPSPSALCPARCTWAIPAGTSAGRSTAPEQIAGFLRVLAGFGVDQIQVTLRSRDVHELTTSSGCSGPRWPRWWGADGRPG